ncbi:MAG TPA: alpha/beta hydrolase [Flavobacteriaceae bacterium]
MSFIQQNKINPRLKKILYILLGLYVMISTTLYFLQEEMLFLPTVLAQDYQYQFEFPFEELFLKTEEQAVINALHFKAESPKGIILYFHGNAGDLSRWGTVVEYFVAKDYDVLVMDYRTYGKSTGTLSENALYKDAQFCYDYLKEHYKESEISIYGRSLGTGIATYLASKNHPKQLILETPYYSLIDIAQKRFPIFPVKQLLRYELHTYDFLKNVTCPITLIHGKDDDVIPIESAEKLYRSASNENLTFTIIEGGSHNNLSDFEAYHNLMDKVLN